MLIKRKRGRPKATNPREPITIRLTEAERRELEREADRLHITLSELLRRRAGLSPPEPEPNGEDDK